MKPWALAVVASGTLLVTLGTLESARPSTVAGSSVAPVLPDTLDDSVRVIVGDTFRIALRAARSGGRAAITRGFPSDARAGATFSVSDAEVLRVRDGNHVTAVRPGVATVTAVGEGDARATMTFRVVDARRATNEMVVEVCPNEDERNIVETQPVSAGVPAIHEYHDCQRLIADGAYSALVGIFAHQNVERYERSADFAGGRLVATIVNMGHAGDTMTYRSLGIAPGINCLVLRSTGGDDRGAWEAAVVAQAQPLVTRERTRAYGGCSDDMTWSDVPPRATRLAVIPVEGVDMAGRRLAPPVARWDWDSVNARNYMGVKCERATWCEIGPARFAPRAPLRYRSLLARILRQPGRAILKGYYDEQFLADGQAARPTTVFGTIRPGADGVRKGQMQHDRVTWYDVAQIDFRETGSTFSRDYRRYLRDYLGIPVTSTPAGFLSTTRYHLRPIQPPTGMSLGMYAGQLNGRRLQPDAIRYRWHSPHALNMRMPTARWRWVGDDEHTWTYCEPDGCCENVKVLQ